MTPPDLDAPGVYFVSLSVDVADVEGLSIAPIASSAVSRLLGVRPELRMDGRRPSTETLSARLAEFWLPDEPILYIGLASRSVAARVRQYYRTPLGARSPHAGGWFLKTLGIVDGLHVHYALAPDFLNAENALIAAFVSQVSDSTRAACGDPYRPFPFGNLESPRGVRKAHGIAGALAPR